MNSEVLKRFLQVEAEKLYHQNATPEGFINRIQLLISTPEKIDKSEIMSENDLEAILASPKSSKNRKTANTNSFFDIVDLSMYRAN